MRIKYRIPFVMLLALAACNSKISKVSEFPSISKVSVSSASFFEEAGGTEFALLPDGDYVINYFGEKINLETGEKQNTFSHLSGNVMLISPNGQYMTAYETQYNQSNPDSPIRNSYVFDISTQQKTPYLVDKGFPAISWSPNSNRFLVSDYNTLVSLPDMKQITNWNKTADFRNAKNTSGDGMYLWDKNQNIPIAMLQGCNLSCLMGKNTAKANKAKLGLIPISEILRKEEHKLFESIIEVPLPNAVVNELFDPSGRYILLAIWEQTSLPQLDADYKNSNIKLSKNVTDSILLLVDWRTKDSVELLRLSNIDKQHFIIQPYIHILWSSDGSTIMVPREDAGTLVIKLKYP